jgi:hypothetical protein
MAGAFAGLYLPRLVVNQLEEGSTLGWKPAESMDMAMVF